MSDGSGAAVTGLVIGILMAALIGNVDGTDSTSGESTAAADSDVDSDGSSASGDGDGTGWGLDVPGVIRTTGRGGQTVALTFSSGPDPRYTPDILAILEAEGVKATFCVIGESAQEQPDLVRQIAAEGHVLCNHSMNYDFALAARDDATIDAEIDGGLSAIQTAAPDASVPFFRAPGGNFSPELVSVASSLDMASLGWNVDPKDWTSPGVAQIQAAVVDAVQPESIVVLHDGGADRSQTVEALPGIIDELAAEGYQFVTPAT